MTAVGAFFDGYAVTDHTDSRTIVTLADVGSGDQIREHDAIIYDADDANAAQRYKFYFSVLDGATKEIWCVFSADGTTWGAPQQCTLGSGRQGEDPSILTHLSVAQRGHAYRIGGKLILYVEDSATATVYGYESADGVTFTELASNPVIPLGAASAWDDTLTASPCARWDGTNVIVGYEGRKTSTDKFGIAHGTTPNGLSKLAANPILSFGDVECVGPSVVVDSMELDDGGTRIVLTGHQGAASSESYGGWRVETSTLTPLTWTTGSFAKLAPNKFNATTSDVTLDNSDPGQRVVVHDADWQTMSSVSVIGLA